MSIGKDDSPLVTRYNEWLVDGYGDKGYLALIMIAIIHEHQTVDGFEKLPLWLKEDIKAHLDGYRESGTYVIGSSAGQKVDHTEKMKAVDRLFKENSLG